MTDSQSVILLEKNMAIIVDKIQKRKDIALSCKKLFIEKGIKDLTISEIAKTAGVGKGTIYEYFTNKEDIIFEIVNILMEEHNERKYEKLNRLTSTRDKIKEFSSFFYTQEDFELRELYKEFISISLSAKNEEMILFQTECSDRYFEWFESILKDGVVKKELHENSQIFARGLFSMAEGIFLISKVTYSIEDIKKEIHNYCDALFDLIEVRDD